jgi:hypothetical protein
LSLQWWSATHGINTQACPQAEGTAHIFLVPESDGPFRALALSAYGHERMVNGRAAASGEKRIDLSEAIAWFGDILNIDGPLVEIGFRSVFDNLRAGARLPDGP